MLDEVCGLKEGLSAQATGKQQMAEMFGHEKLNVWLKIQIASLN